MWVYDVETFQFVAVNDAALEVYGYSREEFLAMSALDLRPEEERDRFIEVVRTAPTSVQESGPWTLIRKDGSLRRVMASNVLIDYENRPCRLVSLVDVTEHLKSKRELEQAVERYRVVRDAGRDAAWDWDFETRKIDWGENLSRTYGYAPDECEPTFDWWADKVHPSDRQRVTDSLAAALAEGASFWMESYRFRNARGEYIEVIDRGRVLLDDETGQPIRMIGAIMDISSALDAREELRRVEDRANQILDSVTDAFVAMDHDGVITYVNRRATELSGIRAEALVGRPINKALPFASPDNHWTPFLDAIRERRRERFEGYVKPLDIWFEAFLSPLHDGMALVFRDISEQHRAQDHARLSHQRYELLAEATKDCIWDLNLDTMEFDCNRAFTQLLGNPQVVRGDFFEWWQAKVHPLDRPRALEVVERFLDEESVSWEHEYRLQTTDESYAVVLDRCRILRDADGRAVRLIGSIVDLTESRATAAFLQEALDHSVDVMMTLAPDGTILHINEASKRVFGYEPVELVGESFALLNEPGSVESIQDVLSYVAMGHNISELEKACVCRDGTLRDMLWAATWSEQRQAIFAVGRDITEAKRSRLELERAVAEQKQLAEKAQAASKAQTEFLQNMSHELRTPLNGLIGMGQLLASSDLSDEQRSWVDIMLSSGEALVAVVNDVLDLSSIEAGRLELHPQPFSISDLVRSSAGLFSPSAIAKGLAFNIEIPDAVPIVLGDTHRLRQVLNNLVGNAVKFTDRGSVDIELRCDVVADLAHLRVEVRDTGIGIDAKDQAQLFERFFQADMTTTRRFGGSGIGLSLVKALIERMGGTIGFYSEVGKGSSFWFDVALPTVELGSDQPRHLVPSAHDGDGIRILIAEDKPLNAEVLERWLRRRGYETEVAEDGLVATTKLEQSHYDLLLLDLHMPRMDGYTAASLIRARESATGMTRLPIVAVTAAAGASDRQRAFDAGVDAFVAKPVSFPELEAAIVKALKSRLHVERDL